MVVYVDDMHLSPLGQFRGMRMCHMIAEQEQELHLMADRIGLEQKKYQGDHYDLPMAKRALAVKYGAVQITMRQLAALVFLHRAGELMGDPETAVDRMRAWKRLKRWRTQTNGSGLTPPGRSSTSAEGYCCSNEPMKSFAGMAATTVGQPDNESCTNPAWPAAEFALVLRTRVIASHFII